MKATKTDLLDFCKRATISSDNFLYNCYKYLAKKCYELDRKEKTEDIKLLRDACAYVVNYIYIANYEKYDMETAVNFFTQTAMDLSKQDDITKFEGLVGIVLLDIVANKDKIKNKKCFRSKRIENYAFNGRILYE